jgi:cobalt-zinc-cadmium efflux system protein
MAEPHDHSHGPNNDAPPNNSPAPGRNPASNENPAPSESSAPIKSRGQGQGHGANPNDPANSNSGRAASHPAVEIQRQPHPRQHQHRSGSASAFRWSVILNSGLAALQLVIGFGFGSLALIGDAVHNLGDVAGLLLGWGAERLSSRAPNERFTYGFGRSTQLASLANAVLILMASAVVLMEGIQRLGHATEVISTPVAWAAAAGIAVNLFSARLFGHNHGHDLNRRAAVIHLIGDAAVSGAVLLSAIVVGVTHWYWLDAATGIAVGLAVAWSGWGLLRDAMQVALDAVPPGIEMAAVDQTLRNLPGVLDVHHLHVWGMSTSQIALTAHMVRRPQDVDDMELLHKAKEQLAQLGIAHSTIQLEPPT